VSLLADVVYEGSRGLIPEYLRSLGASALVVGAVVGAGEFVGHALRLASGLVADATRRYWLLTSLGYGLIAAIPLLALAHSWQLALVLILAERLGKAIRAPARDAILSSVSRGIGAGKAFGVHEFLDQLGAVAGPIAVAGLVLVSGDYSTAFAALAFPFLLMLAFLKVAKRSVGALEIGSLPRATKTARNGRFAVYVAAVGLNTLGLVPVALILYRASAVLPSAWMVPLIYALIQIVDAPSALLAGYAYDRIGLKLLVLPFALSIIPSILVMMSDATHAVLAASLVSGAVLGMQESVYRAGVGDLVGAKRGTAYGVFHSVYGLSVLGAGTAFGWMLDSGAGMALWLSYVLGLQLAAIGLLLWIQKGRGSTN
jgi:MFS family permease